MLGTPGRAALALGFSPWSNPAVAGGRHVLWHNGLGGSVGLAHTASHFSISVFACSLVFSRSLAIALSFSLALSLSSFAPLPPPLPPLSRSRTTPSLFTYLRAPSRPKPALARPPAIPRSLGRCSRTRMSRVCWAVTTALSRYRTMCWSSSRWWRLGSPQKAQLRLPPCLDSLPSSLFRRPQGSASGRQEHRANDCEDSMTPQRYFTRT